MADNTSLGLVVVGLAAVVGAGYYMTRKEGGDPSGSGTLPETTPEPAPTPEIKHETSNFDVFYEAV